MRLDLRILEILWGIFALVIYKLALWPVLLIIEHINPPISSWWLSFVIPPAFCMFIFNLLLIMALLHRIIPMPVPGEYPLKRNGEMLKWMYHASVDNLVRILGVSKIILAYPLLRSLYFFASKASVHKSTIFSYDIKIIDPFMLEIHEGAKIGEWSKISAHYTNNDKFIIKKVIIKKNALIGGDSLIAGGTTVGEAAVVGAKSFVLPNTNIPDGEVWAGHPAKRI